MASTDPKTDIIVPDYCGVDPESGVPLIEPDPDIAGIGVILSVLIIGSLVMLLNAFQVSRDIRARGVAGFFLLNSSKIPTTDGRKWPTREDARKHRLARLRRARADNVLEADSPTPTLVPRGAGLDVQSTGSTLATDEHEGNDEYDNDYSRHIFRSRSALEETLFSLSDTQFATGIAICAAALAKKEIVVSHYLVCLTTASITALTSVAGMTSARSIFIRSSGVKKFLRVMLMWALTLLTLFLDAKLNWALYFAQKAHDFAPYRDLSMPEERFSIFLYTTILPMLVFNTVTLDVNLAYLVGYYIEWTVRGMFPRPDKAFRDLQRLWGSQPVISMFWASLGMLLLIARSAWIVGTLLMQWILWLGILGLYLVLFQPLAQLVISNFVFYWQFSLAFYYRRVGRDCMHPNDRDREDEIGFGQVVALTLLISPIIASADLWWESFKTWSQRRKQHRAPTWVKDDRDSNAASVQTVYSARTVDSVQTAT
ncbi:hypothetical protein OQA88_733 [Cercophora sp. LCS_1]